MHYTRQWLLLLLVILSFHGTGQNLFLEGGIGFGNIAGEEHRQGKGEVFLTVFRKFESGQFGLDITSGGNIIPGTNTIQEPGREFLSANDTRFTVISLLYRKNFLKYFFFEPRLGYANLNAFVHTDDRRKIARPNVSTGIGLGGSIDDFTMTFRFQYLGRTAEYQSTIGTSQLISRPGNVSVFLIRLGYLLDLDSVFQKN